MRGDAHLGQMIISNLEFFLCLLVRFDSFIQRINFGMKFSVACLQ